ncbi:MAG: T9SS type A sorting domain-containing protein [Flavobacteriaceae bacterium]|nr:T9SS type A sorting domain-containing protein [Flavobacteriaceae bacterium]
MKRLFTLLMVALLLSTLTYAQTEYPPVSVAYGTFLGETIPLRDFPTVEPWTEIPEDIYIVPNNMRNAAKVNANALPIGDDPLRQSEPTYRDSRSPLVNFNGATLSEGQAIPPDPSGAVGPDHYVHGVNLVVKIFDKNGALLAGPTSLGAFLGGGPSNGDPIVIYDRLADRFFVSQFRISTNSLIIGISTTPDPTGTYYVYNFPLNSFPDYPHYGIWPEAYFLTANKSGQTTYALERDVMLAGGNNPQIQGFPLPGLIRNPNTVFSPEPAHLLGETAPADVPGYIIYLQDDSWNNINTDHLKIWEIDIDWAGNNTVSSPVEIPINAFDSTFAPFGNGDVEQPGTANKYDNIGGVISYMANYRSFPTHNSFVVNFNVDIDGNDTSGIRWVELRNTGVGPWSVHQEGTWTIADGNGRFMGSNSIDEEGNIALAYNVGSDILRTAIRYTGRLETDPLGQMTIAETSIIESNGIVTNTNRFGDYAQMTLDIDNRTFWHTSEYLPSNNFWTTRIASFKFIADNTNDVGVHNIAAPGFVGPYLPTEAVTVNLFNYGTSAQSNFDIELRVDGNLVATETYTATLDPDSSDTFTFAQTIDISNLGQTYVVEAKTVLAGDEYTDNDEFEKSYFYDILGTDDTTFSDSQLFIYPTSERVYEISYVTTVDYGKVDFRVMNILGQEIARGNMDQNGSGYKASVDLNGKAAGVYIFELQNGTYKTSKKILVR